ncbi:MAG TPA: LacI family DNA-binding transcriptional regulator [Mobilitalea sp.]|nr:LacI family DNA-binding transcriptional regulator [Mobilitalea sp.]
MKKATMQEIADALNISRVTVWKALSSHGGVSDDLRMKIFKKAEEMNYNIPEAIKSFSSEALPKEEPITVSVAVSRPETSMFWMKIIHRLAKDLLKHNINLLYTYLPTKAASNYVLPTVLTNQSVQGMIILNVYDTKILSMLNSLSIPKVFMDVATQIPFESLQGDLVLLEGKRCVSQIVDTIIKRGRTKIGFIGDINYALTNYERYDGFLNAMYQSNIPINHKYNFTGSIGIDTYQEEIEAFLDQLDEKPEAFVCASDYIGHILLQYCSRHKIRVPQDIAISGYDNNPEYNDTENLTTVQVQNETIGKRLVAQLLYRMENPDASYEIITINSKVEFRKSTDF